MVGRFYVVVDEQIGSAAAAGTVEFRPAVRAFVPGVDIEPGKFFGDLQIESLIVNIAHAVLLLAYELVAGIDIALRRDGHVFAPGAAAADPLDNAGPLGQIDVEMEEIEIAAVHHDLRQLFIFCADGGQIFLPQGVVVLIFHRHGFDGDLVEAFVRNGEDILCEVEIFPGKRAAEIKVFIPSLGHELFEFRHDHIVAALAVGRHAEAVVHLFAAVQGQNAVVHFPIDIIDGIVVQQDAVRRDGEAEMLSAFGLPGAGVGHRFFHHIHGHQRLAAEEIDFDVAARSGALDDEVDGGFGGVRIHQKAAGAEIAGGSKAVFAAEIAVVGYVQAQRLDGRVPDDRHGGIDIVRVGEQFAAGNELLQLPIAFFQRRAAVLRQFFADCVQGCGFVLHGLYHRIGGVVQDMDGAAVDIHCDVLSQQRKGMYH